MERGASHDVALLLIELGAVVVGLAVLARLAARLTLSPIPFYLVAGLALGQGGLLSLDLSVEFIELGGEIGVVLLLLTLGLEYTADELVGGLRTSLLAGLVDLVANFGPGLAAGLLLGWDPRAALVLGGVTYVSSSGIVAKVLADLGRTGNRETPVVLSILVLEDLFMALYLPILAVVLAGRPPLAALSSVAVAVGAVGVALVVAHRHGTRLSSILSSPSDEALLLSVFGLALLVAGGAERLQVSAAVGAFLLGVALSQPVAHRAAILLGPLRDLFAATFFFFFSLQIDPGQLPRALPLAAVLAAVTGLTKMAVGAWAAARVGVRSAGRLRAGAALVARGEFSIVIAGLGIASGLSEVGTLAAAYVLLLAVAGPVLTRFVGRTPRPVSSVAE